MGVERDWEEERCVTDHLRDGEAPRPLEKIARSGQHDGHKIDSSTTSTLSSLSARSSAEARAMDSSPPSPPPVLLNSLALCSPRRRGAPTRPHRTIALPASRRS
ncbi:hypothetical protein GUJ93_ZPchr0002g23307 [Zizania palustris]|uniref:Uncharacterized protein n=1 Tax=Zizania palustris TaxID=103762 RepID=A0A8J5RGW5_ZIZPA|nr:hypothetical protein GUJ93_ZPchr0002g23307 [Zizania palustris]